MGDPKGYLAFEWFKPQEGINFDHFGLKSDIFHSGLPFGILFTRSFIFNSVRLNIGKCFRKLRPFHVSSGHILDLKWGIDF